MRRAQYYATLTLAVVLAVPGGHAWGHPVAFFPGQAFCPPRPLIVGAAVLPQQQCFSLFLVRSASGAFLGFVPAGLFVVPFGQNIGVGTALGRRIKARALLLPIALPVFFVPMDTIRQEYFQVEDVDGQMGIRFAEDPNMLVPVPQPPSGSPSGPAGLFGVPLPVDVRVDPPGQDVPQDEAAFSGRWGGQWRRDGQYVADEGLPHLLIIEQILRDTRFLRNETRVVAVFAWGTSSQWDAFPGWLRAGGVFQRGVLLLTLSTGAHASYRISIDGTLKATYEGPEFGTLQAVLSRMR